MAVLKMITAYVILFVYIAAAAQVNNVINKNGSKLDTPNSVSSENDWIFEAQNSIKKSLYKVKLHGVESAKIKIIVNEAFDTFTQFVKSSLSDIIKQMNNSELDEIIMLKTQLMNWSEGLEKLNKVPDVDDKSAKIAVEKFIITIDYIVSEDIVRFGEKYNFQSSESKKIIDELQTLLKESVTMLVEHAKSVEDQVSGFPKTK